METATRAGRHYLHEGAEDDDDDDEDDDEEDDDEEDDEDDDGDAVDDVAAPWGGNDAGETTGPSRGLRTRRSCWPPPQSVQQPAPRAPVWSPLFRVQPTAPGAPAGPAPATATPSPRPSPPGSRPTAPRPAPSPSRPGSGGLRPVGPPRAAAAGNPVYGNRMRLYCRTGYHLAIGPKGRVSGTADRDDKYTVLEFSSVNNGEVRIRGVEADLFLAMNKQGKLYGQANIRQEGTVFVEMMLGQYNTYLSRKYAHAGWYVGLKKNGRQKPGMKTAWGQKAIQFLPIRV